MALYETVFIARQDISSAQAETLAQTFSQMIVDNGGQIMNGKTRHQMGLNAGASGRRDTISWRLALL